MTGVMYDLDHPPVGEWRDEQDRSEWFEEAAYHWCGEFNKQRTYLGNMLAALRGVIAEYDQW